MFLFTKLKTVKMDYEKKHLLDSTRFVTKRDYPAPKNRHQIKKLIALFCCICFFSYVFIDFNIKSKLNRLKDHFDFIGGKLGDIDETNSSRAYFVDTPGCRMPSFNVIDDSVVQYMFGIPKLSCGKPLTAVNDQNEIVLNLGRAELVDLYNITDLDRVECYYQEFRRKTDFSNLYTQRRVGFGLEEGAPISNAHTEFVKVVCGIEGVPKPFYRDFHFIAVNKTKADMKDPKRNRKKVSVMIIGIDSVSRLNFLRQMNRTATLLRTQFNSIEMMGYNKVGDNTYPNLVPALSGLAENELNMSCLVSGKNTTYDKCPFIWKRFKEAGYKTVYVEDVANLGLFNYFRSGFRQQPADYYLRPLFMEMEKSIAYKRRANMRLCLGGRRPVDVVLDAIHKLTPLFKVDDFFSFFWMASLTHDFFNMPQLIDDDIADMFLALNAAKVLKKKIVFFMSDHGLRWGSFRKTYQGMMEERQPLLLTLFPDWFVKEHPLAVANFKQNSRRLTTHYDLHATLLDLLDLSQITDEKLQAPSPDLLDSDTTPRSISLFQPIPITRTCELAGVASHWCTCHEKEGLQTNDQRVQRAARFIVKLINDKLRPYKQCRMLYLNSIREAVIASTNKKILKDVTTDYLTDITVRIQTKPGLGEFESTVRMSSDSTELTGTISRVNMYGTQSYCISDYLLKMFCYCHR